MPANIHPAPVQSDRAVPWEPLGQISPNELPSPSETYPGPWTVQERGNGHVDVIDARGRRFAHVYCWDSKESAELCAAIVASEKWATEVSCMSNKTLITFTISHTLHEDWRKAGRYGGEAWEVLWSNETVGGTVMAFEEPSTPGKPWGWWVDNPQGKTIQEGWAVTCEEAQVACLNWLREHCDDG